MSDQWGGLPHGARMTNNQPGPVEGPIAMLDVQYGDTGAVAACVVASQWHSAVPSEVKTAVITNVEEYEPGAFYKRELPCLLAVLNQLETSAAVIVVDGYVWLSADGRKGLGWHLFDALGQKTPVIGVAKTAFQGSSFAHQVFRGTSEKPLYVTCVGIDDVVAISTIRQMHGLYRMPTLLKQVDQVCRTALNKQRLMEVH